MALLSSDLESGENSLLIVVALVRHLFTVVVALVRLRFSLIVRLVRLLLLIVVALVALVALVRFFLIIVVVIAAHTVRLRLDLNQARARLTRAACLPDGTDDVASPSNCDW